MPLGAVPQEQEGDRGIDIQHLVGPSEPRRKATFYLLAAIMLAAVARSLWPQARSQPLKPSCAGRTLSVIGFLLGLLTLALAAFLTVAFPVFSLPDPAARHTSFGDPCLWSGGVIHLTDEQPEIACDRMVKIQNVYSLAFFNQYLRGISSPLLNGPSPDYPDTRFRSNIAQ